MSNKIEKAALNHVCDYIRDVRSGKVDRDIRRDIERRVPILDIRRASGRLP